MAIPDFQTIMLPLLRLAADDSIWFTNDCPRDDETSSEKAPDV